MYKPVPMEKNLNSVFSAPEAPLFCLKSVPLTGNELAGDDVDNFEKLLTLTDLSHLL